MNDDPVIVDDDVDMEAVVILDEDDENIQNEKTVGEPTAPTVETIDLDDGTPIITKVETLKSNTKTLDITSEISFRRNLENNRLMDKIVTTCINMENAMGMPRVVYKTLLPLYRDTNNRFKESDAFRALLKKTYKQLLRDPDHKFLHIKTLCEELKSGGLRRKVPFVTLATNLKSNGSLWDHEELTSSSREINHNNVADRQVRKVYRNTRKKVGGTRRKVKQAKKLNKPAKKPNKPAKKPNTPAKDRIKTRSVTNAEKEMTDIIDLDDSETETVVEDNNQKCDGQNDVIVIEETEPSDQKNDNINTDTHTLQETIEEDSNKENNDRNGQSENEFDYELLIPTNVCNAILEEQPVDCVVAEDVDKNIEIARLEKQITFDKMMIDKLEEAEVFSENPQTSPYYLCSKYKENIVNCYKKICELKGDCKGLVKRREIRLRVAEGHPSGPAEKLEEFLNETIDETGTVQFPDFSDVVQCVVLSNCVDNLRWTGKQVIQEAVALFRQCGQALRKRRQKREYEDLLSFVRDKEEIDDPAEKDPVLLAKLEENKLIAKIKEEEILNRYVSMESNALMTRFGAPHVAATAEFESDKDSSDSESEQDIAIPNNISTSTISNQPETGESSRSNINLGMNQPVTGEPSRSNINLGINQPVAGEPSRSNINLGINQPVTGEPSRRYSNIGINQPVTGESSRSNTNLGNNQPVTGEPLRKYSNIGINQPVTEESSRSNINLGMNQPVTGEPSRYSNIGINQPVTGESSRSNINLGMNQPVTGEPSRYSNIGINQPVTGESSRSNINLGMNQPVTGEPSRSNINLGINQPVTGEPSSSNINLGMNQPVTGEPSRSNINLGINQPVTGEPSSSNINLGINQPVTGEPSSSNINLGINQPVTGEPSSSNINLGLLQSNSIILTTPSNYSETTKSPNEMNKLIIHNFVTSPTAPSYLVFVPPTPLYFIQNPVANKNQCATSENSIMNNAHNNNNSVVLPTIITSSTTATMFNERETLICSDRERMNSKVNTVSETVLSSNDATINGDSDRTSINTTNIRSKDGEVNSKSCDDTDVHNNVSSTTDGVEENCDSSISSEVKPEDVKREPLDIQNMLDQLEDGFVCQVFDIEDPFLVIEISSDGFTDDEE